MNKKEETLGWSEAVILQGNLECDIITYEMTMTGLRVNTITCVPRL